MTDPCGQSPTPMDLRSMAEDVARAMGRFHPGRPAFSALSRACDALRLAAQEVDHARQTYAPADGAALGVAEPGLCESGARFRGER